MSLSGLVVGLGVVERTSVGRTPFEFVLPLPMAIGVALLGAAVLVSVWAARA